MIYSLSLGLTQWTCLLLCQWIFTQTLIIELNQRLHHDDSCWWWLIIIQRNIITDKLRKEPLISWMHCYANDGEDVCNHSVCVCIGVCYAYASLHIKSISARLKSDTRARDRERETHTQRAVYLLCVGGGLYRIMYLFSFRLIFLIQYKKE